MENHDNPGWPPVFTGAPRHRLPFRSVFMPIVPCVLDGVISLLELIAKLEYIVNQYHDAIEQNHTDIMNLYQYIEGALEDLREYIDTQDAATLQAAKDYNIDLAASWMVGDGENDVKAGIAAGCNTAMIGQGDFGQTLSVSSVAEFVEKVLEQ